ncbi:MAG: transposase [Pseudonocardiaceae bacterium]
MIAEPSFLVALLRMVARIPPPPPPPPPRGRGRPVVYPDRLFLQGLLIMIVRRLETVPLLVAVLAAPTEEMARVRAALAVNGRLPDRRTWERRWARVPAALPAQIGCLGRALVELTGAWASHGRAVALDSTLLRAQGGVWHVKQRAANLLPVITLDVEADWGRSGWHGWVYRWNWKLQLASVVAGCFIPLAASRTKATVHDATAAPALLDELPPDTRFVLGDTAYQSPTLPAECGLDRWSLVAPRWTPAAADDPGTPVRAVLHRLRHVAAENLNELLKDCFGLHGAVPTTGLLATQRSILGCVFVYQVALWYRAEHGFPLNVGLKAFLRAA